MENLKILNSLAGIHLDSRSFLQNSNPVINWRSTRDGQWTALTKLCYISFHYILLDLHHCNSNF